MKAPRPAEKTTAPELASAPPAERTPRPRRPAARNVAPGLRAIPTLPPGGDVPSWAPISFGSMSRPAPLQRLTDAPVNAPIQRVLTAEGQAYKEGILDGAWGGFLEAQTLTSQLGVRTAVYGLERPENQNPRLKRYSELGRGTQSPLALAWVGGNHYQVIVDPGQAQVDWNANMLVHDPVGDGNCMYEAISYIYDLLGRDQQSRAPYSQRYQRAEVRNAKVQGMRQRTHDGLDDVSANLAGTDDALVNRKDDAFDLKSEQLMLGMGAFFDEYPPADWYIDLDAKKPESSKLKRRDKSGGDRRIGNVLKAIVGAKKVAEVTRELALTEAYAPESDGRSEEFAKAMRQKRLADARKMKKKFWTHIAVGEFKSDKKTPTGYHWTGLGDESAHVQVGQRSPADAYGVYHCGVASRDKGTVKDGGSTFFPDNWDEDDFVDAFSKLNSNFEITADLESGKKAKGMKLQRLGKDGTIFPLMADG